MLTGQRPFDRERLVSRMLSGELVLPTSRAEPLLILERLLFLGAAARPQDASQTAIALAQAVGCCRFLSRRLRTICKPPSSSAARASSRRCAACCNAELRGHGRGLAGQR